MYDGHNSHRAAHRTMLLMEHFLKTAINEGHSMLPALVCILCCYLLQQLCASAMVISKSQVVDVIMHSEIYTSVCMTYEKSEHTHWAQGARFRAVSLDPFSRLSGLFNR